MKNISLIILAVGFCLMSNAQSVEEGKKLLRYGRLVSAEQMFDALVKANPADAEAAYWLGQLYIEDRQIAKAKELYSKALVSTNQNPLLVVGMGHIEMMEKKTAEGKAKFEAALNPTKNRKNKQFGDPFLLSAIGRANATGDAQSGDIMYGIEKLQQAAQLDLKDPDIMVNLGMLHLKRGGEYGGEAKRAFEDAIERDPNYGLPYYRIGKIFESQRNFDLYLEYYNKAAKMDPKFAPAYLSLYQYYQNRDVNKAKEYLDQFIANNDPDRETDYFYADYMFRAGNNQESIEKGKAIEASLKPGEVYAKVYRLYALNYDRLGDSVKARDNMEKFMQLQVADQLTGDDYAQMATYYLKFPGQESKADGLVEKAVAMDTVLDNKLDYMRALAAAYEKQANWAGQFKWLNNMMAIRADTSARNYYFLTDAAHKSGNYEAADKVASQYIASYPDQIQGYYLRKRSAVAADPDTSLGSALPAIDEYTSFLMKDLNANKGRVMENHGYKIYYYLIKSREYVKALESANAILAFDPENDYAKLAAGEAERLIKATGGKTPTPPNAAGKATANTEASKTGGQTPKK